MKIVLKNPRTGELKKVGWSWILFLLSSWFGIPLFLRRLYLLSGLMIAVNIARSTRAGAATEDHPMAALMGLALQGAYLAYLGFKGNELTAKSLTRQGLGLHQVKKPGSAICYEPLGDRIAGPRPAQPAAGA